MNTETFLNTQINFSGIGLSKSILICFFMASFYVISLYLWSKQNRFNRDESSVIKRRFISVAITSLICFVLLFVIANKPDKSELYAYENSFTINKWIGFKIDSTLPKACTVSLLATMVLFSGPLLQYIISDFFLAKSFKPYEFDRKYKNPTLKWITSKYEVVKRWARINLPDLCFWRNYVISPFTEEFVFRSCMLPLLIQEMSLTRSILVAPLFFGLAHLHHIIEGYFTKEHPIDLLILQHLFQFTYTYIFGLYSSFLFLRTGNFFPSFLTHSFCNFMGFPNFRQLFYDFDTKFKWFLLFTYVIGLVLFILMIGPITEPDLFDNHTFLWYS